MNSNSQNHTHSIRFFQPAPVSTLVSAMLEKFSLSFSSSPLIGGLDGRRAAYRHTCFFCLQQAMLFRSIHFRANPPRCASSAPILHVAPRCNLSCLLCGDRLAAAVRLRTVVALEPVAGQLWDYLSMICMWLTYHWLSEVARRGKLYFETCQYPMYTVARGRNLFFSEFFLDKKSKKTRF